MPNARDATTTAYQRILVVGEGGSGKTTLMRTLPGRKFAYLFDPAALASLQGCDIEYEQFLPDSLELDMALKGFNKGSKDDTLKEHSKREPSTYMRWATDLNTRHESGFFKDFDWLCFDSLTFLADAVMDRQKWLNGRYGGIEDLADYRIAGSKIAETFRSICSLPINIYCTGHITSFQDEKTKRIQMQINLPGRARSMLPLVMSQIWEARSSFDDKAGHVILTRPEPRGFQALRTTIKGLDPVVDVTIKDFSRAEEYGIGKMLRRVQSSAPVTTLPKPAAASASTVDAPQAKGA